MIRVNKSDYPDYGQYTLNTSGSAIDTKTVDKDVIISIPPL